MKIVLFVYHLSNHMQFRTQYHCMSEHHRQGSPQSLLPLPYPTPSFPTPTNSDNFFKLRVRFQIHITNDRSPPTTTPPKNYSRDFRPPNARMQPCMTMFNTVI